MKIVGLKKLHGLTVKHADCKGWIQAWRDEVDEATWVGPQDIKQRYSSASFLAENTVVFNVKGNSYRLVIRVAYGNQIVFVLWAGTHAEYSKEVFP